MDFWRKTLIIFSAMMMMMMNVVCSQTENIKQNEKIRYLKNDQHYARNNLDVLESSMQAKDTFSCPVPWGKFPDHNDCSFYYDCKSSKATRKKCLSGRNFDKDTKKCVKKSDAVCETEKPAKITFKCPYTWGTYLYPEDCSKHYLCLFSKPNLMKCDLGELYDEKKRKCQDKKKVYCGSRFNPYGIVVTALEQITTASLFWSIPGSLNVTEITTEQSSHASPGKISKITSIFTLPTLEEIANSSDFVSEILSKAVTPSINTTDPQVSTTPHLTSLTVVEQVITSVNTSLPETHTTPEWISLTIFERTTTVINVSCPQMLTTPYPKSSTISERVTTPITITLPKTSITPHFISSIVSMRVTTPLKTSLSGMTTTPYLKSSTISERVTTPITITLPNTSITPHLISSIVSMRFTTPVKTPLSGITTTPYSISSTMSEQVTPPTKVSLLTTSTTPDLISIRNQTNSEALTTSESVKTTSEKQPSSSSSTSYYTTPRGCAFGDESCPPDEILCPEKFGEFPHPDTPVYFLHCDHWRPYLKKCPHNLHFDPQSKVCNWPK